MDVRDFLHKNRMELQQLAIQCDVNKQTLSIISCHNKRPSFKMATKIVKGTNYHVGYSDLLPEIYDEIIKEYIMKTKGKSSE